jgi:hypothetical protein
MSNNTENVITNENIITFNDDVVRRQGTSNDVNQESETENKSIEWLRKKRLEKFN